MNVKLDVSKNLVPQFQQQFKMDGMAMNPKVGTGEMIYRTLPNDLEFYHFTLWKSNLEIDMTSINPTDSEWYLIHINLGKDKQLKRVGDQVIEFHRYLPSGILIYCPGLEINTKIPQGHESELATFRFSRSFLRMYFDKLIIPSNKIIIYEDLDYLTEKSIRTAISHMDNRLQCHANVLVVLGRIFEKIASHEKVSTGNKLHGDDIRNLFLASAYLRNPTASKVPSIVELADMAKMSATKFKLTFKQLFGSAPLQYRNKIRMEYAREELRTKRKGPTEISNELGYSHPSNFTSAYKKHFNELPSLLTK